MAYLGKTPSQAVRNRYKFTPSAGATSISGNDADGNTLTFADGEYLDVYLNGVLLVSGDDYTPTPSTNTISSLAALASGDVVEIVVYDTFSLFGGNIKGDLTVTNGTLSAEDVTVTGLTTTGNINFGDNDKALFGAGNDLQVWHSGANSFVVEEGTGSLFLGTNGASVTVSKGAGGETMGKFIPDGAVELYYNSSKKLETTNTGIDVTGNIEVGDGHTIGEDVNDNLTISSSTGEFVIVEGDGGVLVRQGASATNAVRIASGGDISFYADNGTTQGLFWDASTQRLGLGTTSPATAVDINGTLDVAVRYANSGTFKGYVGVATSAGNLMSGSAADELIVRSTDGIAFAANNARAMTITSGGDVGIGTTSPSTALDVSGTVTADGLTVDTDTFANFGSNSNNNTGINFKANRVGSYNTIAQINGQWDGTNVARMLFVTGSDTTNKDDGRIYFQTSPDATTGLKSRVFIDREGDISFYDSTGVSQGLFWDASEERLGLGTTTPVQVLDVRNGNIAVTSADTYQTTVNIDNTDTGGRHFGVQSTGSANTAGRFRIYDYDANAERMSIDSSGNVNIDGKITSTSGTQYLGDGTTGSQVVLLSTNTGNSTIDFGDTDDGNIGRLEYNHTSNYMGFRTNNAERMRIDSNGNVGIGTTSPATGLHVSKTSTSSHRVRVQNGEGNADYGTDGGRAVIYVGGNLRLRVDSGGELRLNAEGGSVSTVDVRQGTSKVWISYNQETNATRDSYNISSITDNAVGAHTFYINSDMNNASYSLVAQDALDAGTGYMPKTSNKAVGSYKISVTDGGSADRPDLSSVVQGDLA